jgi:hypothetical protein
MALTWNIAGMEKRLGKEAADNFTTSPFPSEYSGQKAQWHPVTNAIVWRMMTVGMASITEDNFEKVYLRIRMYEHLTKTEMAFERDGKEISVPVTRQDIINHIGLTTNVSTLTDTAWAKKFYSMAQRESALPMSQRSAHDTCLDQIDYAQRNRAAG